MLRKEFKLQGEQLGWKTFIPNMEYCTDNAAMIAITGFYKFLGRDFSTLEATPSARSSW